MRAAVAARFRRDLPTRATFFFSAPRMASAVDFCGSPGHTPQFKQAAGCVLPEPPRNMPCSLVRQFSATPCTENSTFGCLGADEVNDTKLRTTCADEEEDGGVKS